MFDFDMCALHYHYMDLVYALLQNDYRERDRKAVIEMKPIASQQQDDEKAFFLSFFETSDTQNHRIK